MQNSRTYQELVALNSPISNPYVRSLPTTTIRTSARASDSPMISPVQASHVLRGGFGLYYGNVFQNIPIFMEQMAQPHRIPDRAEPLQLQPTPFPEPV